ncbi:Dinucleotide-utilizing enzymes involved in molybdopterin and thiamine biosynthesis family 2 [Methanosarcina barkeri str. Wiesmoor]|uniref:Dinucleotide-utilizing enzymes involved in molybdopterin and thiamine biosynthesis family 2 n=2 Tax=Methanosarcina barkeri TaxID=2208 RepID=A0A0E3QNJ8_METBA|nr:HesA/MoeB/ThiF family protein [Methanosarcina barkeri]AKB52739.1 Dinucleotide-utilizing enzymes involved in molybdopterin and thiamine biosynthesis family 2 [Methanosarcina barkeri str. Wiesmoor]
MNDFEREKYSRQILLFGEEGQEKLKKAKVLVAGAGGLGSPVSTYLAIAGVGKIILADFDSVDPSNLNRQFLHHQKDIGRLKIESAKEKLLSMNPDIEVETIAEMLTESNLEALVPECDVIVDALDNLETRHMLNKLAIKRRIPLIHGAVTGYDGQVTTIVPGKTPCFYCIFPRISKKEVFPVLGATPGIIGSIQANEVIKFLTGQGKLLEGRLLFWNGLSGNFSEISLSKLNNCPVCGNIKETCRDK